jgi:hypothetical protein
LTSLYEAEARGPAVAALSDGGYDNGLQSRSHPARSALATPDQPVALFGDTRMTYRELDDLSDRERMAAYKYPRTVEFVAELPKNAMGKILKDQLTERPPRRPAWPSGPRA